MLLGRAADRLPTFLIIGSMKAGTTTLYDDLSRIPGIAMSVHKEPNTLIRFDAANEIRRDYALMFAKAKDAAHRGEASTVYTKIPSHVGAPERARRVLGPDLKLIYLRRDPLERILSQYRYEAPLGIFGAKTIDEVLREDSRFINYSNYAMQAAAWLEHYPEGQLLQLDFERYVTDRLGVVRQVCGFLGVEPPDQLSLPEGAANATAGRRLQTGWIGSLSRKYWYTRHVKPLLPPWFRSRLRMLAPKAPDTYPQPREDTLAWLRDQVNPHYIMQTKSGF